MIRALTIGIVASVAVSGCAPAQISDVKLARLAVVDYWREVESSLPFGNTFPDRSENMLKVYFRSSDDYLAMAVEGRSTVSAQAYFCDDPELPNGMSMQYVFWDGILISSDQVASDAFDRGGRSYGRTYYTYLPLVREHEMPSGFAGVKPFQPYNLATDNRDVCLLVLAVGSVTASKSNEVRITSADIALAAAE